MDMKSEFHHCVRFRFGSHSYIIQIKSALNLYKYESFNTHVLNIISILYYEYEK